MKLLIINDINSGFCDGSVYDFMRSFAKDDDQLIIRNIIPNSKIIKNLYDANEYDIVVVSGDDDLVSAVSYYLADTKIPILTYPSGSWNLISQNLFLPSEPHALAKIARKKQTMSFDVGQLTVNNKNLGFGCNAGIGYSTKISKEAITTRKLFGPFAYIGAAINNYKPQISQFKIQLKHEFIEAEGIGVLILNFSKIGLDLSVTHQNRPRDGKFEIVILKGKTAFKYVPALTAAMIDKAIEFPDRSDAIEIYNSSYVKIDADPKMEIQLDGTCININTPFEAKVLKHAATYVVDDECLKHYK